MTAGNDDLDTAVIAFDRKRSESRIKLIPFDEVKLNTERRYLVKRLIPRTGLCLAWGSPSASRIAVDMFKAARLSIARLRGRTALGRGSKPSGKSISLMIQSRFSSNLSLSISCATTPY
jgi:hypothetical protein